MSGSALTPEFENLLLNLKFLSVQGFAALPKCFFASQASRQALCDAFIPTLTKLSVNYHHASTGAGRVSVHPLQPCLSWKCGCPKPLQRADGSVDTATVLAAAGAPVWCLAWDKFKPACICKGLLTHAHSFLVCVFVSQSYTVRS